MRFFSYKTKTKEGITKKGIIEAASLKQASGVLRKRGFFIIELTEKKESFFKSFAATFQKVKKDDIAEFTRQLATMLTAGLPLTDCLILLRDQTDNQPFAKIIDGIIGEVQGGTSLKNAFSKYPYIFDRLYISLVGAGESAGALDKVLVRLADTLEKEKEFRSKTQGALIYPAIILVAMIIVIFIMMVFVIPKLTAMYKDFNVDLPTSTKILIAISGFSTKFFPLIAIVIMVGFIALKVWTQTPVGSRQYDELTLKIPLWGKIKKLISLTEFTRTLGLLISAGIPILEALKIVAGACDSAVYKDSITQAAKEVERGLPLGVPISYDANFPPIVGQMLKVGEESGKTDEVLIKLSAFFEAESEHLVKALTTAIEPIIMVVLGLGVGFIVLSVLTPIYNLTSQF